MEPCVYSHQDNDDMPGTVQCPHCKRWYCEDCAKMFINTGPIFGHEWVTIIPICPSCHYNIFTKERGAE